MNAPSLKYQTEAVTHSVENKSQLSESKKGIIYPEHATYALRRRMIVPKWWVESILFTSGKKYAWYDSFITERFDQKIYEYFKVTSINMFFMIFLWDDIIRKFFSAENQHNKKIKIDLTPFLIGTEKQKASILKKIQENLIKPISVLQIKQIEDTKKATHEKHGYLNIFKKVHLIENIDGIWLTLDFAQNPLNAFGSPEVKSSKHAFKDCFITINPNLFYAMGSRVNLEKALNGLFLEYNKQNEGLDPSHTSFEIDTANISKFHKHALSTAEKLYNHGILDGCNVPPATQIAALKKMNKTVNEEENEPFVFVWHLSSQSRVARNFEASLSNQLNEKRQKLKQPLFSEPPKDQLKQMRVDSACVTKNQTEIKSLVPPKVNESIEASTSLKQASIAEAVVVESATVVTTPAVEAPVVASTTMSTQPSNEQQEPTLPRFLRQQPPRPNFQAFSERELTIFVARFYETLTPRQKQMFESERRSMTREQFRAFVIPILQRNHATLPTQ